MSRKISPEQAAPGDLLIVNVRDSYVATRYALPRARRHPTMQLQAKVGHASDQRSFRLDLSPAGLRGLLALLAEKDIRYEVCR